MNKATIKHIRAEYMLQQKQNHFNISELCEYDCILHDQHELKVPESQTVTHFYCESHLLCMHFSHIGTQKI